ncbi:MFS Git1p-related glycerophosphoinositol and glycerophosphocholine permease [Laccaria bicolor S238N-H82]|uniref:MFS Git1p-related glycerophosphoinositol and glycerophosphocholine permease n=1 Tax=Laccaria bicolor (strain S238N-H82 / ATCC MYA-4686) TaxID=486041 RepID=B0D6K5_LACBS|nr:MFS Git1p-related glycerophosphoinositol and glycerophosphocholine permease [Laccaria bicolor S238N-H82]EDR09972.1 MFS Git1p-related glycerophosphoinositol and glycerophosphocholine permease [Laccaria bicolor S238N-H82]|eukprot:XP_001879357.1 MFS Git1p-related glycerophosphoinositol and glycerophosphocholine permease [Laccaria bicolor S238N-H82]
MATTSFKERLKNVSLIFACGTALFSDGYANGVIGSVNTLLSRIYGADELAHHNYSRILTSVAFAGTIVGMLTFGYLSDKIGRKFGMPPASSLYFPSYHLLLLVLTTVQVDFSVCLVPCGVYDGHRQIEQLQFTCRVSFLLGIGIGAEYPCGSVSASEQSEEKGIQKDAQHRWFALATNAMIDFGFVISAFVPLVLFWIFGEHHLRAVWRLSLGLGVVPALAVFIWRLSMEEPTRYQKDSMQHAKIPYRLVFKRYGGSLAAISATWFLYDIISYPFGIYSSIIVDRVTGGSSALSVVFGWNVIIYLFYMPGTIGGAFIVDYLGPKWTMITGLLFQAFIGFIMSGLYKQLTEHIAAFAVVYGVFLSFGELGPGNCLGLLASKSSPTAVRGQFYGIAAAIGKVGAFIGIWNFGGANTDRGNTGPFWIGSGFAVLSALITLFFIRPLSHDGMVEEDRAFREYLEANGYDTSTMGLKPTDADFSGSVDEKDLDGDAKIVGGVAA